MPAFNITAEVFLGYSHYGAETAEKEGQVVLSDEQVDKLVELIKSNNGETDVESLDLKGKYPDIFEILDSEYWELAHRAAYNHWVVEGYKSGYYEDLDEAIETCEKEYGFSFEFDEKAYREENGYEEDEEIDEYELEDAISDAKSEAFDQWISEYRSHLDEDEDADFLAEVFQLDPSVGDEDYKIQIPEEIVDMVR